NVSTSALAERPIEARLAGVRQAREDNGHFKPIQVVEAHDDELRVLVKNDRNDSLELDFLFEPQAPHYLLGMRVNMNTGGMGGAPPPPVRALPQDEAMRAFGAYLDSLSRADVFSGAVLVAKGDEVLLEKAYGLASRERPTANDVE